MNTSLLQAFNPLNMLAGWRLILVALVVCALPVHGQQLGNPRVASERTADWYARHDAIREDVVRLCRNSPGEARSNVDCAAASQGNILAAEHEARRNIGDMTPPTNPRYWRNRPMERREYLASCARLTPEQRAQVFCAAAGYRT